MMNRWVFRGMSCLSLMTLVACGENQAHVIDADPNAVLQTAHAIRVLEDRDLAALTPPTDETSLTFSTQAPVLAGLKAGDILVADSKSENAPSGLLRRVTSIEGYGNQTVLKTETAALDDVFYDAKVNQALTVGADDIARVESHLEGVAFSTKESPLGGSTSYNVRPLDFELVNVVVADQDGNPATTNDQLRINGRVTVAPRFDVGIDIGLGKLNTFRFVNHDVVRTEFVMEGAATLPRFEQTVTLATLRLAPITFAVGPVPVVLVPTATLSVKVAGSIGGAMRTEVSAETQLDIGFEYTRQQWALISDLPTQLGDFTLNYGLPTVTGNMNATAGAEARAALLLYGMAGPYATVTASSTLEGSMNPGLNWALRTGVRAEAGVEADLFKQKLNYSTPLFNKEWDLANGQM